MKNAPLNRAIADHWRTDQALDLSELFLDAARRLFVAAETVPTGGHYLMELRYKFEDTAESLRDLEREVQFAYMTQYAPLPGEDAGCGNFVPNPDPLDVAFGIDRDEDQ